MLRTGDISARPWFRPAIAAWFAVLFGGGTLAILLSIPREALEWRLGAIGLADLHPAFAAPVGGMGLLPLAGIAALIGMALGLYIADRVMRTQPEKPSASSDAPWEADATVAEPRAAAAEEPAKIRVLSARDDIDEEGIPAPKAEMPDNTIWLAGSEVEAEPDRKEGNPADAVSDNDALPDDEVHYEIEADAEDVLPEEAGVEDGAEAEVEVDITPTVPPAPRPPHFSEWQEVGGTQQDLAPAAEEAEAEAIELDDLALDEMDEEEAEDYLPTHIPPLREDFVIPHIYGVPEPELADEPAPDTAEPEPEIILEAPELVSDPAPLLEAEPIVDPFPASPPASIARPQPVAAPDPAELSLDALTSRLGRAMKDHRNPADRHGAQRPSSDRLPDEELGQQSPAHSPEDTQNALRDALEKLGTAGKAR